MRRSVLCFAALIALLLVSTVAAQAQQPCSLQKIVGTYAMKATGEAFVGSGPGPVPYPSIAGALTPMAFVGIVQIHSDGHVTGSYWMNVYGFPITKVEGYEGTITLSASCIGEWKYPVMLPGSPDPIMLTEKIVVLDEGKEIRTATMVTGIPFAVWNTTVRRISGSLTAGAKCRQNMTQGSFVNVCKGYAHVPQSEMVVPMVGLMPLTMDAKGSFEGTFYAKMGPQQIDMPFEGTVLVSPDCYGEMTTVFPAYGNSGAKGVLVTLEEGKELWLMLTADVAPNGTETPHLPALCDVLRTKR